MSIIQVLAIDGGSRNLGVAIINYNTETQAVQCLDATHFVSVGVSIPEQLDSLAQFLKQYIDTYQPSIFVYEAMVFKGRFSAGNAIGIQNAMGVIRLITYKKGLEEYSYSPKHVKLVTTGKATADKHDIINKVSAIFPSTVFKISHNHAADAVAIGLTYLVDQYKIKL